MTGTSDAQALHRNHQAFWRHMARATDGSVTEIPGGLLVATGIPAAPFNQLHCGPGEHDVAVLVRAAAHFESRGLPWRICAGGPSAGVEAFTVARRSEPEPPHPIFTRALGRPEQPSVDGLTVSTARSARDMRAFIDCAAQAHGYEPSLIDSLLNPEAVAHDDFRFYLGRVDGECVAVSVGVREGDTVGVYFVGVRPGFQGRGYGRALTEQALFDGAESGATTAVVQATPAGYPVCTEMGFEHVGDYHTWNLRLCV
ncbi:GNAT family N-acetyltransferase [Streptomyces sp. NBC_00091]|uniref:GNAT family N-acetyltransferase n=1 Tax=Streptomyces sp. NBC_00091 TaxID=2975648 RepID=UPI0022528B59|nr:GNAT family N-acetyltransferase [Streptomyces sp. NBC_00091]MCX5380077.1 GNAT family N-acetyltransferase [Streptomyces sp. NBC_00091]